MTSSSSDDADDDSDETGNLTIYFILYTSKYSSVPNRRAGRNKRAGGKILKKH